MYQLENISMENDISHAAPTEELSALEDALVDVLLEANTRRLTVSSDFAREHAAIVAMAASQGLITTKIHLGLYGRYWVPTLLGLRLLNEVELDEEEA